MVMSMKESDDLPNCIQCGNIMKKDYQSMIPSRSMREYHGGVVDYDITGNRQVFRNYEDLKKAGKKAGLELV